MKKFILALCCMALLTGCSSSNTGIVKIKAIDAVNAIENKETMVLMLGKTDCDACKNFQKVLDEFFKNYDMKIHEVLIDKEEVTKDETTGKEVAKDYAKLEEYIGILGGTPSVFFIQDGEIIGTFTGSISYDSFRSKVEKYGFLPEQ